MGMTALGETVPIERGAQWRRCHTRLVTIQAHTL